MIETKKKRDYPPEKIVEIKLNLKVKHLDKLFNESRRTTKSVSEIVRECIDNACFKEDV